MDLTQTNPNKIHNAVPVPFFSIVIPVYRLNKDYFDKCINSVLNQTFTDFEVVLVDDGSPDDCGCVCDEYAENDSRVRVLHQSNSGVSVARNNGVAASRGKWILFVDGDDWLEINTLSELSNHLLVCDVDILHFGAVREYIDQSIKMEYGLISHKLYDGNDYDDKEKLYRRAMQVPNATRNALYPSYYCWDKVYKRSFLIDNKVCFPIGIKKSEDKLFILACLEKVRKYYFINEYLYHYRINEESVCHSYFKDIDIDRLKMFEQLVQIATRMNIEIATARNNNNYSAILKDCNIFFFGVITDVLVLKYYHPNYPKNKKERRKDALAFLRTELVSNCISTIKYSDLHSRAAKIKKFLLGHNMIDLFVALKKRNTD